jgi:hypothetical protein
MINLPRMHRLVWQFREDTADVLPIPHGKDGKDSLRFAVTEACGEALDAHLRENPTYKRNRDKDHSEHRELAQALFMLYTAYGHRPFYGEWWPDDNTGIDDVVFDVAMALKFGNSEIVNAIRTICQYVGDGIEDELVQALDALRAKHGVTVVTEVR